MNEGVVTERLQRSAHPSLTPCQLYKTANGWIFIMCNKEKFWPILCQKLNRHDWVNDARFKLFKDRLQHRDTLQEMLDNELSKSTEDWLNILPEAFQLQINNIQEAMENPFVRERGAYTNSLTHQNPMKLSEWLLIQSGLVGMLLYASLLLNLVQIQSVY